METNKDYADGGEINDLKIKAHFEYANPNYGDDEQEEYLELDLVGLVKKNDFESQQGYGLGYVEGSDMMTDAEGFDMYKVLEGKSELNEFYKKWDGEVGSAKWEVIEEKGQYADGTDDYKNKFEDLIRKGWSLY